MIPKWFEAKGNYFGWIFNDVSNFEFTCYVNQQQSSNKTCGICWATPQYLTCVLHGISLLAKGDVSFLAMRGFRDSVSARFEGLNPWDAFGETGKRHETDGMCEFCFFTGDFLSKDWKTLVFWVKIFSEMCWFCKSNSFKVSLFGFELLVPNIFQVCLWKNRGLFHQLAKWRIFLLRCCKIISCKPGWTPKQPSLNLLSASIACPWNHPPKGLAARLAATALMPSSNPKNSLELKIQGAFF